MGCWRPDTAFSSLLCLRWSSKPMVQGETSKAVQDATSRAKDSGTNSEFGERGALQAGEMARDELRPRPSSEIRDAEYVPEDAVCGRGWNKTQAPENQREGCTCNVYMVPLPLPAAFVAQDSGVSAVPCGDL